MDAQALKSWLIGAMVGIGLGLGMVAQVQAFHFPWDQGHDITDWNDPPPPGPCEGSNCDPCNSTGSPVYLPTGHFVWTDVDVVLKGTPVLSIARTFNSHDPRSGLFGNGWSVGCDEGLFKVVDSNPDGTTSTKFVLRVANGKRYEFVQQPDGSVTSPAGRYDRVVPQANGTVNLVALDGSHKVFRADGKLSQAVDRNGNAVLYNYDGNGLLSRLADVNGRSLSLTYNSGGRVATVTDHAARVWQYAYDVGGNLETVTDPLTGVRRYQYKTYQPVGDGNVYSQLTRITDASNVVVTQVEYNGDRVMSYTEGANRFAYGYNLTTRVVTKTDSLSSIRRYTYNTDGLITQEVDPLNNTTASVYDTNGNLLQRTDPSGRIWRSTYDTLGRSLSSVDPLGNTYSFTYTGNNPAPSTMASPSGRTTQIAYDAKLNPVSTTDPSNAVTQFQWSAKGDLVVITDAAGQSSNIAYTTIGLPASATDPLNRSSSFTYDARGNLVEQTNAAGERQQFVYDALDRLVRSIDPLGQATVLAYDAAGRLLSVTDPAGRVTAFAYDTFGRPIRRTSPDGRVWTTTYRADNLQSQVSLPDARTLIYSYDAAKRLISENAAGQTTTFTYSARDELLSATGPGGAITRTYDALGRLLTETNNGQTVTLAYNADNERTQLTALGVATSYTYDTRGFLTGISRAGQNFAFTSDLLGRRTQLNLPNGAASQYGYDAASQLTQIAHTGPFATTYGYSHDAAGRITQLSGDGANWNYQYDTLSRLTQAAHGADVSSYAYDPVGNLLNNNRQHDSANRLIQDNDYTFTYDVLGNLTSKQHKVTGARTVYTWNAKSQLTRVERFPNASATTATKILQYTYDPLGRRASKTEDGVQERYVYDGLDLVAVLNASGVAQKQFTFGPGIDEPLAMTTAAGNFYFHANHQGSVTALTSATGVVTQYNYDAYGQTQTTDTIGNPFRYTGREQDAEDLYYYRARYYDPTVQRFISEDPIAFSASDVNFYRYVFNNPLNLNDPSGLIVETAIDIISLGLSLRDFYCNPGFWTGLGLGWDAIATVVPFLPAGFGIVRHADDVADLAKGANKAPDFIVSPNGTTYPVPKGAQGPTPVINPAGKQTGTAYTGGTGGANGQVDTIRIMDPTPPRGNSPGYPNGYIKYENAAGQGVDPYTGKTLPNSQSHFPIQ